MKLLFVHQSFPGQYRHLLLALSSIGKHEICGLGIEPLSEPLPSGVTYFRYSLTRGNTPGVPQALLDFDSKLVRGESCLIAASQLCAKGYTPDLICVHPGWGEALFLSDVWPSVPLICYQEFFYNAIGFDSDFDPELQGVPDLQDRARIKLKNANLLLMLNSSTWNVTPTKFQYSTFPSTYQSKISVIHDGIDTNLVRPDSNQSPFLLPDGTYIYPHQNTITFVNRNIEPYRGCHTFIRSIPHIQKQMPNSRIVIVGEPLGVSYGKPAPGNSWKDTFLDEISSDYNPNTVHFTGSLSYKQYLQLLKMSACHVYLTYPFVLSWSLLEAMSSGIPIVGSLTPPVQEIIQHDFSGLLVDFFSPQDLADAVTSVLSSRSLSKFLSKNARQLILDEYSLNVCIPKHLALLNQFVSGGIV